MPTITPLGSDKQTIVVLEKQRHFAYLVLNAILFVLIIASVLGMINANILIISSAIAGVAIFLWSYLVERQMPSLETGAR